MNAQARERGSVSVELALLAPALLLLLSFAVVAGRTQIAEGAVQEAARAAAREASLARDAATAAARAGAQAERTLAAQDLRCERTTVDVDTAGFQAPLGQPGDVTVSITCVVGMADLLAPGLPGSVTVEASFISPIDAYRER
ncbi:pilus assembly protein TadE [Blastococcus sp. MG754426]|uniref:TadE-like protein n=1 Tax=Blastococcus aggregatus TaxID=38502 RepID=A0A285VGF8_9ACTN|nr:pilus assembly protein TadE [Blastococcus sp. MG754426]MCF6511522.1 pilus assembly protein TadE [Blastococcus sp. MG754427]SOC53063.1 TadE-like protein [Blastococcus aggregatus]SSC22131.1 TadE-like protein [Klenkia terrae]